MTPEAIAPTENPEAIRATKQEFGPWGRSLARRYFETVRFSDAGTEELRKLSEKGFVVHVMRTSAWINYVYLAWALVKRTLPPIRAVIGGRRWFTRPFTKTKQDGTFAERFAFSVDKRGSALVFLRRSAFNSVRGVDVEDAFPALVDLVRSSGKPVFLVPELFVWEKWNQRVQPSLFDRIFGSPEAPGFLHSIGAFLRNFKRAQYRVGEPIDLKAFIDEHPQDSTALIARKVRSTLHHHLARESRAVFGPPKKLTARLIDEAMRDRVFQKAVHEVAKEKNKPVPVIEKEARKNFEAIAARYSPTALGTLAPILNFVFSRIYDGIDVDEAGLERAMKMGAHAPIVLVPSHKSHVDYLIMSFVLWQRGYAAPLVAAGANLSFFPLGWVLRRSGAFFLRRSFKGDALYTATFKAYLKKLVHDGMHHEFFPEGGRSRTGKLLQPKLGLFTWLVDAVLEGASRDLHFVPVAIDYEKVVEGNSYKKELQGGEKQAEDIRGLLAAPKVLTDNYGRIHLRFNEPISLVQLIHERGLAVTESLPDEQKKNVVRALGNRVMFAISQVSTVTPHALLATALLAHRKRGIAARDLTDRIVLLRTIASDLKAPFSQQLQNAPSSPVVLGPIADAMRMFGHQKFVRVVETGGDAIFQVEDSTRLELSFYKNTILNLVAGRTIVARALLVSGNHRSIARVKEQALALSRLFKFEFIYAPAKSFDHIFDETLLHLKQLGLILPTESTIDIAPEAHVMPSLQFLAEMLTDYIGSYALTARQAALLPAEGLDKKEFLKLALDAGRRDFLASVIALSESISKPNIENALAYLIDQKFVIEQNKKLMPGTRPVGEVIEQLKSLMLP